MKSSALKVRDLIEPTVSALDLELWGIEYSVQGKYSVLRIFIESDAGITIDDCEKVSRQVSAILDVEDPIAGEYTLEVSSPGLDRRLVKATHFERFAGERVKVKLKRLVDGRRNFKGRLVPAKPYTVWLKLCKLLSSMFMQDWSNLWHVDLFLTSYLQLPNTGTL